MNNKQHTPHPAPRILHPNAVYFIGIGGVGMSALARYYKHAGATVAGYDRTPSTLTAELEREGIDIHYEDDVSLIPAAFLPQKRASGTSATPPVGTLVIYTPAVPAEHRELNWFKQHRYTVIKRSEALGHIAAGKTTIAIAGTHGKTTISALTAHLLTQAGRDCTAFMGGISKNYHTNVLLSPSPALVSEADEFDRSFLQLFPQIAVVTAADADHLDVYDTPEAVTQAYVDFIRQVQSGGTLILKKGLYLPIADRQAGNVAVYRYAADEISDFYATNIRRLDSGLLQFDLHVPHHLIGECVLGVPARVNIENAIAAVAAAWMYMKSAQKLSYAFMKTIRKSLASFNGVQRRFDVQFNTPHGAYVDDYAHHPAELRAAITSLRETFPERKITGIFQPHLYTRTRDFADDFADSLSLLDELILLDIYPAREEPIPDVTATLILDKVTLPQKQLCAQSDLLDILETKDIDVLVTFGAGDIDRLVQPLTKWMKKNVKNEIHPSPSPSSISSTP
ncbi:MAG: UDP-N-acetylmuramate--L-alanine ligase [Prevotellaceae bacterium]|jgi:UDP-N-acetylmuramate--alanine ligase|nr:UDP-N-acetylmuramate--L-alanine ligase [Prevotellaceae bacterium]